MAEQSSLKVSQSVQIIGASGPVSRELRTGTSLARQARTSMSSCWRVFYTSARAEKKCEAALRRLSIEVFLPKVRVARRWRNGVRKTIEEPLFPNYLFAHVSERERVQVLETRGIVRSVMFDRKLAAIPEVEIERLRIAQRDPQQLSRMVDPLPRLGQWVEVKAGPFQGLRGPVLDYRGRTYVVIRISPINQCARVQVPADLLSPC